MVSEKDANRLLAEKYAEAVNLKRLAALADKSPRLSGLFLPGITESYLTSRLKVMIVGKETRGWAKPKEVKDLTNTENYIECVMKQHVRVLRKPPSASKFFQFYRAACQALSDKKPPAADAVAWANLFCLSYRSSTPTRCLDSFEEIKELSRTLLRIQVEVFRPDVMLFVTGTGYDSYIKEFFDVTGSQRLVPKALWSFKADGIQAYRTSHPQWEKGRQYREQALVLMQEMATSVREQVAA
ncbi:hypothetical protein [Noviherbaspirillum sp. UKPF54]|uniref:hypothetical protein n=1 Tax=Noviherbaspirillum sp. UKPF54 TaxID=2601898 RepID=UPI0011B18229|nr:hypothetical protein [Noviherbaspirillum sp. UKPF54]QDZ26566.1 hypothetical protein FAY22_00435 [Noviherbaspirillum sp. UKPF54]